MVSTFFNKRASFSSYLFSGILTEHCDLDDSCDLDAYSFKGIFTRNLRYLIDEEIENVHRR